jgi:hypothetical protein
MCTSPSPPPAPAPAPAPKPRNVLQIYGRTLDLDKPGDVADYEELQRREQQGLIDRQGRELIEKTGGALGDPTKSPPAQQPPRPLTQQGDADQPQAAREQSDTARQAKKKQSQVAQAGGRKQPILAGSQLGDANTAKKALLGE